jgi:diguanylate cyclase (GGDEF)-like protein/PAS domain S-box-containing protein
MDYAEDMEEIAHAIRSSMALQTSIIALAGLFADWNSRHTAMLNELELKRRIFESVHHGICLCDATAPEMPIVYVNRAFERMTGYAGEEVRGRSCRFLQGDDTTQEGLNAIRQALREHREAKATLKNYRKDGTVFWNELHLSPLFDHSGRLTHYVGILSDATARVELERRMEHMAQHDPLTGLPNRAVMMDRLGLALANAKRHGHQAAVLFLDLDGFKAINDEFGHEAGDVILQTMADRIKTAIRDVDCAARMGGDEFVLVASGFTSPDSPELLRDRLRDKMEQPVFVGGQPVDLRISMGLAVFPADATSPRDMLHAADIAMYADKRVRTQSASPV